MRYLTFALAKGRLAEQSLDLLEKSESRVKRCGIRAPGS